MIDPKLTVIGIDANSHKLALVWKRDGSSKPHLKTFELAEGDSTVAAAQAFRYLSEFFFVCCEDGIFDPHDVVVYMEAPVMGVGGPGATIPQAFVEGAVMAWAGEFSLPLNLVNNQSWKKKVCGNGNINKIEVTERMHSIWPELMAKVPIIAKKQWTGGPTNAPDQDLVDAGAVFLFGEWKQDLIRKYWRMKNAKENRRLQAVK